MTESMETDKRKGQEQNNITFGCKTKTMWLRQQSAHLLFALFPICSVTHILLSPQSNLILCKKKVCNVKSDIYGKYYTKVCVPNECHKYLFMGLKNFLLSMPIYRNSNRYGSKVFHVPYNRIHHPSSLMFLIASNSIIGM